MRAWFPVLLLLAASAHAEMADPTRPPPAFLAPAEASGSAADAGEGLRLQSVLLPQGGKPVAVIGGKTVVLGGRVGDARLLRLTEREAVLQGPEGTTHLYLTPKVDKRMIETPESPKGVRVGTKKGMP